MKKLIKKLLGIDKLEKELNDIKIELNKRKQESIDIATYIKMEEFKHRK